MPVTIAFSGIEQRSVPSVCCMHSLVLNEQLVDVRSALQAPALTAATVQQSMPRDVVSLGALPPAPGDRCGTRANTRDRVDDTVVPIRY